MAVVGYELFQVAADFTTADMVVWQRYKMPAPGMVEKMLDANPQLSVVHRTTPFIPVGTLVRVPIDQAILAGQVPVSIPDLWTDRSGYTI